MEENLIFLQEQFIMIFMLILPRILLMISNNTVQNLSSSKFRTELLRRVKRYQVATYRCLVIKYEKDTRYDKYGVSTHDR